jgi:hypothetical protein
VTVPHEQRKVRLLTQIDVSGVDELRREEMAVDALLRHEQDPPREILLIVHTIAECPDPDRGRREDWFDGCGPRWDTGARCGSSR